MRYFAYGTNVNPAVLARKALDYQSRCSARLPDHVLRFDKRNQRKLLPANIGFANVAPSAGDRVEGVLYEMADEQLEELDRLERCPDHYERVEVTVETAAGAETCFTYRARPEHVATGLVPSRNYLNHILAAGDLLSAEYRAELEQIESYAGECATCHQVGDVLFQREGQQLFVLCTPCIEARRMWGDTIGRTITILETEAVMMQLRRSGQAFESVGELIRDAVDRGLLSPAGGGDP